MWLRATSASTLLSSAPWWPSSKAEHSSTQVTGFQFQMIPDEYYLEPIRGGISAGSSRAPSSNGSKLGHLGPHRHIVHHRRRFAGAGRTHRQSHLGCRIQQHHSSAGRDASNPSRASPSDERCRSGICVALWKACHPAIWRRRYTPLAHEG